MSDARGGMFGAQAPWQIRYAVPKWQEKLTKLSPQDEVQFQQWAQKARTPITPDYDMRGFWKSGGSTQVNPNDGMPHYTDRFKTPLHQSFSGESIYSNPLANPPRWNEKDQLVDFMGNVLFDERATR